MTDVVSAFAEINDLKRVRVAGVTGSIADRFFRASWAALVRGDSVRETAFRVTGQVVAAARLGGIDRAVLRSAGLTEQQCTEVLQRGVRAVWPSAELESRLEYELVEGAVPEFVDLLCAQPRAGATRPGKPRIVVLPAESHGDHCLAVAVYAMLLAPRYGATAETGFLAALAHHFHNAYLPDSGFTGEEMLGGELPLILEAFRNRAMDRLSTALRTEVEAALAATGSADSAEGRAFHAADVLDRVLQMRWYEQAAGFKLTMALDDMDLVHAGPVQEFHKTVLRDAGLW